MAWLVLMAVVFYGLLLPSRLIWCSASANRIRWLTVLWGLTLGAALLAYGLFPQWGGQPASGRDREAFLVNRWAAAILVACLVPWLVAGIFRRYRHGFRGGAGRGQAAAAQPCEEQLARNLIAAIDRGGVPLNPAKVNDIARRLGLEVTTRAPVEETIERIRAAVGRFRA